MSCDHEPVHFPVYELDFKLVVFKSELVQQGGGAWEQGSVRLHLHLDEQKEEKWAGECEHNFLKVLLSHSHTCC